MTFEHKNRLTKKKERKQKALNFFCHGYQDNFAEKNDFQIDIQIELSSLYFSIFCLYSCRSDFLIFFSRSLTIYKAI